MTNVRMVIWYWTESVGIVIVSFFILAPEFGNEGEISSTIKRPLCLVNELV